MGFVGGFASLFVLRVMLGVGESLAFPGSSKIIARHVPPERRGIANAAVATGIALGPAVGTLAGGLIVAHWGWRAMFFAFGAVTLALAACRGGRRSRACPRPATSTVAPGVPIRTLLGKWPLWSMSIVHALGNYCFYFLLAWLPLFLTKSRGFSITEMTLSRHARLCGAGRLRLRLRPFLRLVDALGPVGGDVPPLDDGRQPVARRRRHPRSRFRP